MTEADNDVEMAPTDAVVEKEGSQQEKQEYDPAIIREALFASVEGAHGAGVDDQETNDDDEEPRVLVHLPLVRLFDPSCSAHTIQQKATARQLKKMILETLKTFHKGYVRRFFSSVKTILELIIEEEEFVPESVYNDDEDAPVLRPEDITPDARSTEALQFILYATQCVQAHLDAVTTKLANSKRRSHVGQVAQIVTEVVEVAELLHNGLLSFAEHGGPDALPPTKAIMDLCESWWHANAIDREELIVNLLPLLIFRATGADNDKPACQADVKRLVKLQGAFRSLDFTDENTDSIRFQLLKLVSAPHCLHLKEGRKFISGLFHHDPGLAVDLHEAIKIQMPGANKTMLKNFSDIYNKAWKASLDDPDIDEEVKTTIKDDVVGDLMDQAIHMENPRLFKSLLVVLEPFHEGKKYTDYERLLYDQYGGILWRSLNVANAQVRINAATIFGEVFPLQEPSHKHTAAAFKKGAEALSTLMKDNIDKIRVAGSTIATKVLCDYWDVIAPEDIRRIMQSKYSLLCSSMPNQSIRSNPSASFL